MAKNKGYYDKMCLEVEVKPSFSTANYPLVPQIPNNPYKFEVTVVKSDVVNAFALPGGYVVVFTGLMKKAETGEEVAGVLGHELNHVLQRHGMERIVKNLGLIAVVSIILGDQQGLAYEFQQWLWRVCSIQGGCWKR